MMQGFKKYAPSGTNITWESLGQCPPEENVSDEELAAWSSRADESFLQATTALRQAIQAASKVRALEQTLGLNQDQAMTLALEHASPFTQRLMLYYGLTLTLCEELRSIVPIGPVTAATDSLKPQASESSPLRRKEPFSPSSSFEGLHVGFYDEEPPRGSVVLDHSGDAWQRRDDGLWSCAIDGNGDAYSDWDWRKLTTTYRLRLIYRGTEDD